MSAVFLLLQSDSVLPNERQLAEGAAGFLPFTPEASVEWSFDKGRTKAYGWSTVNECARGSYWDTDGSEGLFYQGWVQEDLADSMDVSIAANLRTAMSGKDFEESLNTLDGDYCLTRVLESGVVESGTDFLGGTHLYYGEKDGLAVVSNRALVAAAALHGGSLPSPNLLSFAWLHFTFSSFLRDETPWPNVRLLRPRHTLQLRDGQCTVRPMNDDRSGEEMTWDEAIERFTTRCSQVQRVPDVKFQLALTGGKDSRAVLGGLASAGQLGRIQRSYLFGDPSHPDALVGRTLAEHYGLPFETETAGYENRMSFWESLEVHNFHAEGALNAWDRKGIEPKTRLGDIRGYYGEIYKSHEIPGLGLSWAIVKSVYLSALFIDPQRVLTKQAQEHCRKGLEQWIEEHRSKQLPARHARNLMHRDTRMNRWVGQAMQWDATGPTCLNPIHGRRLLNKYLNTPRSEQKIHRFHHELIRRTDPWLAAQSFANYQWPSRVLPKGTSPVPATKGSITASDYRFAEIESQYRAIESFLLDPTNANGFFELYDRKKLERCLRRSRSAPTINRLKAILGACATRLCLRAGITPSPITFPTS
jgi:hypothetical protein